ncbi:unnamed protein product [Caretta caretta]
MSTVVVELDNLSPEDTESENDARSVFSKAKSNELHADCYSLKLHSSYSAPAGVYCVQLQEVILRGTVQPAIGGVFSHGYVVYVLSLSKRKIILILSLCLLFISGKE